MAFFEKQKPVVAPLVAQKEVKQMSTAPPVVVTAPPVVVTPVAPKQSFLQKLGSIFGKVLKAITGAGVTIEKAAVPVAEALLPEFTPLIQVADGIFSNIVKEAIAAESVQAAAGTQTGTGAQKLAAVLANVGPVIDTYVAANFPGASKVSTVAKSGLISAVVGILNELDPPASASTSA